MPKPGERLSNVRGWTVVGADGEAVGKVHGLVGEPGEARYLDVELAPALAAGMRRRDLGLAANEQRLPDRTRLGAGAERMLDVNPASGEVYPTGEGSHPGAHEWKSPEEELRPGAGSGHVLIPVGRIRVKEGDDQIVLDGLRGRDLQELAPFEHSESRR